jgi:hypothetical protein
MTKADQGERVGDCLTVSEADYPEVGQEPTHRHLTACEVLCWIGYRRAISKEQYFAPLSRKRGHRPRNWVSLLHETIPSPKPRECPIHQSERILMEAMRAHRVHSHYEKDDRLERVPREVLDYAVVVNVRGGIEPDNDASARDRQRAEAFIAVHGGLGSVWFDREEILREWPANELVAPQEGRAAKPTERAIRDWMRNRVSGWPDHLPAPTEDADYIVARKDFGDGLSRVDFRGIRQTETPHQWRTSGPRRPWGFVKPAL